jgi:hypothetical protein
MLGPAAGPVEPILRPDLRRRFGWIRFGRESVDETVVPLPVKLFRAKWR